MTLSLIDSDEGFNCHYSQYENAEEEKRGVEAGKGRVAGEEREEMLEETCG